MEVFTTGGVSLARPMNANSIAANPVSESACVAGHCPLCGGDNGCPLCAVAAYTGSCWCMTANISDDLLARVPAELRNRACLCAVCVAGFPRHPTEARPCTSSFFSLSSPGGGEGRGGAANFPPAQIPLAPPAPRLDGEREPEVVSNCAALPGEFYFEAGRMVFTAAYHLRRGDCCGSGCRHCPFPNSK